MNGCEEVSETGWDDGFLRFLVPERLGFLPPMWRYALAIVVITVATVLRWAMVPWLGIVAPYNVHLVTDVLVIVLFGIGPGLLAVVVGDIAVEVFVLGSLPTIWTLEACFDWEPQWQSAFSSALSFMPFALHTRKP